MNRCGRPKYENGMMKMEALSMEGGLVEKIQEMIKYIVHMTY
jgi:hypothetical protein